MSALEDLIEEVRTISHELRDYESRLRTLDSHLAALASSASLAIGNMQSPLIGDLFEQLVASAQSCREAANRCAEASKCGEDWASEHRRGGWVTPTVSGPSGGWHTPGQTPNGGVRGIPAHSSSRHDATRRTQPNEPRRLSTAEKVYDDSEGQPNGPGHALTCHGGSVEWTKVKERLLAAVRPDEKRANSAPDASTKFSSDEMLRQCYVDALNAILLKEKFIDTDGNPDPSARPRDVTKYDYTIEYGKNIDEGFMVPDLINGTEPLRQRVGEKYVWEESQIVEVSGMTRAFAAMRWDANRRVWFLVTIYPAAKDWNGKGYTAIPLRNFIDLRRGNG